MSSYLLLISAMDSDLQELYMNRCLFLARLGKVAPNPVVGAVLVHQNRVIGEGYHKKFGDAHAEVNCIQSVTPSDLSNIPESTLFVSLEPCAHFGKTPPCADLIIESGIPKVVIGCRDPFLQVNGKGIEKLLSAGVEVVTGVLEKECLEINKRFFTFHTAHRPHITLKWAQTGDGKIANEDYSRVHISNEYTNRLVHKWRSEAMAIVVGTNTALFDDPVLTTRLWPGANPIRIVVDLNLRLPARLKLFDEGVPTIIFNIHKHTLPDNVDSSFIKESGVGYYQVTEDVSLVSQMMHALYQMKIESILVEGGSFLLQSFIDDGLWDEAKIITNESLLLGAGLPAPVLKDAELVGSRSVSSDMIKLYKNRQA
jgi:diaminohydroxyphosphoribosylaminopyrimidine deaminase/5-amino-6-(5-phosphoribosylamino)uracil reductase